MKEEHWKDDYSNLVDLPEHGTCGICNFLFTSAIVSGLNPWGYEDRWCYHTHAAAVAALKEWEAHPEWKEPEGWHRQPTTGRRRPNGDKTKEYVNR